MDLYFKPFQTTPILGLSLGLAFVFWASWIYLALFWVYPIEWKRQILKGKTWVYIPKYWNRFQSLWKWGYACLRLLALVSLIPVTLGLEPWISPYVHMDSALALVFGLGLGLQWWGNQALLRVRFRQQEDAYFQELFRATRADLSIGRRSSEAEISAKVNWSHQNILLKADLDGQLLQVLKERTKRNPTPDSKEHDLAS